MLEHTLQDHADQQRLLCLSMAHHFLDIIAAPAAGGVRPATIAEGVNADRQTGRRGSLINWPVAPLPERLRRAAQQQHLGNSSSPARSSISRTDATLSS